MNESMLCTKTHEYVLEQQAGKYEIGITDYAIEQLGDIVFVELPEVGAEFAKNEAFATIESVKAASEYPAELRKLTKPSLIVPNF